MSELLTRKRLEGSVAQLGALRRSFAVDRAAVNAEARTVELSFSSEEPYDRWFGVEILDHAKSSVRLGRLQTMGAVLVNHDLCDQVAVVEEVSIGSDRKGRARVRFGKSPRADEIFQDVVDGIRGLTSVGYMIHEMVLESSSDTGDVYRVTDWEPYEISLVTVPADTTVGVGREAKIRAETRITKPNQENNTMSGTTATPAPADLAAATNQARDAETARVRALVATGRQFGFPELADEYVAAGKSVADFQTEVLKRIGDKQQKGLKDTHELGLSDKEVRNYSLMRAIRALAANNWKDAGFERECHEATMQKQGVQPAHNGFFVPYDVQARTLLPYRLGQGDLAQRIAAMDAFLKRDMTAGTGSGGGYLVATDNLAGSFIELLRARAKVVQLGATMLPGLVGNVTIPRQTGASTAYWLGNEATAITESNLTFGQLALTPKHVGDYVEISKQLMMQSSPAIDALVMADINKVIALAIDAAALNGSGAAGQPTGVINTSGVGSVTGTSINWAGIVEFEGDVATANADVETMAFLTTPAVRQLLKARDKTGTTVGNYVWGGTTGGNTLNGYRAEVSTQVPSASMVFGDWAQIVIGEWMALEIALNPYANFAAGITGVRGWATVDVGVRQAGAFSIASSIT